VQVQWRTGVFSLDITGQNYRALFVSDSLDLRARMVTSEMGLPQVLVELVESWSMGARLQFIATQPRGLQSGR
jgi:hypothetical protein